MAHPLGYTSLLQDELRMVGQREKPEDIVLKLHQVEILQSQGKPLADAVRQIGVTVLTYYRWRKEEIEYKKAFSLNTRTGQSNDKK